MKFEIKSIHRSDFMLMDKKGDPYQLLNIQVKILHDNNSILPETNQEYAKRVVNEACGIGDCIAYTWLRNFVSDQIAKVRDGSVKDKKGYYLSIIPTDEPKLAKWSQIDLGKSDDNN